MKIILHNTSPDPVIQGTEAVLNEIKTFRTTFDATLVQVNPSKKPNNLYPAWSYGLAKVQTLRQLEKEYDIHHIFCPRPMNLSYLKLLQKPKLITITSNSLLSVKKHESIAISLASKNKAVLCFEDKISYEKLLEQKVPNIFHIPPVVNLEKISSTEKTNGRHILMASSPWTESQIKDKGLPLIFEALQKRPDYQITVLLRGQFESQIKNLAHHYGILDQVHIVNKFVNVDTYLKKADLTILLAKHAGIVKAYPHSLLESIAAGVPVVCNQRISLSNDVRKYRFGDVLIQWNSDALIHSIENAIRKKEEAIDTQAYTTQFAAEQVVKVYEQCYRSLMKT